MLENERAARPLEEEVGRNPVACDTGRGNLCSASRRRRDRGAGCWSGMPRRDRRRAAASDRRRRRWLAGTCHTFARPARPRACLARPRALVACFHSWSPDLEDLQAARHARGSSQPDRDTTPAAQRTHPHPGRRVKLDQAASSTTRMHVAAVGCLLCCVANQAKARGGRRPCRLCCSSSSLLSRQNRH